MRGLVLCLAVVSGCLGLEFVAPQPVPTQLHLSVVARHDSATRYSMVATFERGSDGEGLPYMMADSTLTVDGGVLDWQARFDGGALQYQWERSVTPAVTQRDSLVVVGPRMATAASTTTRSVVPLLARLDPGELVLAPGGDLRLHVTPASDLALPATTNRNWQLSIRPKCDSVPSFLTIIAEGAHPDEILLTRAMLPADTPSPFEVCLRSTALYTAATSPYRVTVLLFTDARWRIQLGP